MKTVATNIKTNEVKNFSTSAEASKFFGVPSLAISSAIRERGGKYGKLPDWLFSLEEDDEDSAKKEKKEKKVATKKESSEKKEPKKKEDKKEEVSKEEIVKRLVEIDLDNEDEDEEESFENLLREGDNSIPETEEILSGDEEDDEDLPF